MLGGRFLSLFLFVLFLEFRHSLMPHTYSKGIMTLRAGVLVINVVQAITCGISLLLCNRFLLRILTFYVSLPQMQEQRHILILVYTNIDLKLK